MPIDGPDGFASGGGRGMQCVGKARGSDQRGTVQDMAEVADASEKGIKQTKLAQTRGGVPRMTGTRAK